MKSNKMALLLVAAIAAAGSASAAEFSTFCTPSYGLRTLGTMAISNHLFKPSGTLGFVYIGIVNSSFGDTFLWAGLPSGVCTNATIVMPIASGRGGKMRDANLDVWSMGFMESVPTGSISTDTDTWQTYDDTTPAYAKSDGTYYYLNDHAPVKVLDDVVVSNTTVSGGATLRFEAIDLLTQIGMAFNRGALTNNYLLLRFNPDHELYAGTGNSFWPTGYSTDTAAAADPAGSKPAMHIVFSAPDDVPAPSSRLSADEQASDRYVRSAVDWVQYRDSDGAAGFSYPAYCGVKDGKTRDLIFTFDAPAYSVTNGWLTVNALPPFAGTVPAGAKVSLSLLGFVDAPSAGEDLLVTDAMLEGQEPVLLQEYMPVGGITAGRELFTDVFGQRILLRALNARAKSAYVNEKKKADQRTGRKAVLRISVDAETAGAEDWGFSIGSVATPRFEAFFECVEYRENVVLLVNRGFENGLEGWTIKNTSYTENQIAVVEDPLDSSNHCLRFQNIDTPTATLEVNQIYGDDALVQKLKTMPYWTTYRLYMPTDHPITKRSGLTEYGYMYIYGKDASNRDIVCGDGRIVDYDSAKGSWINCKGSFKYFNNSEQMHYQFKVIIQFICTNPQDVNQGDMFYIDDFAVNFEDFYEIPPEPSGMRLIIR